MSEPLDEFVIPPKEYENPAITGGWKMAAQKRLEKAGLWDKAKNRRLELVRQYGLDREEAWKRMVDEFPPDGMGGTLKVGPPKRNDPLQAVHGMAPLLVDEIPNVVECAHWAFSNVAAYRASKKDPAYQKKAPNAGCWVLLIWADDRFTEFMTYYTKLSLALAKGKEEAWDVEYDRLDRFLETAERISRGGGAVEPPRSPDGSGESGVEAKAAA
jgi:hypothetical protein